MANDILLQEGHPVDENLRPIKIGGEPSSLELSQYENGSGARITGDLEVTGNIKGNVKDVVLDLTTINSTDLTIDDAGDITLSAAGGDIIMDDGAGNNIFTFNTATPEFRIIDDADNPDDYCSIAVAGYGVTTVTTNDDAGVKADLIFEVDGEINFNVKEPSVRFKDETTEIGFVKALSGEAFGFHGSLGNSNGVLIRAQNGDINLESADDVIMDANSGIFQFQLNGDTDDLCTLTVAGSGATTLATADSDGTVGHIVLDADGSIVLDSHVGTFVAKNAGTEFSVRNSAYAGMILGYTTVGIDAADDQYNVTASFAVTDAAHKVKFVAPPSGVVEISVSVYGDFNRRALSFGLSDNATYNTLDVTHEHTVAGPPSSLGDRMINHSWVITGLTPGTAYEYWLGAKSTHILANVLRWGGDVTGEYAPFIMKATALPTALAEFAVYG